MSKTTNLNLNKPEPTDFYNVSDFNENMDTIDTAINDNNTMQTASGTGTHITLTIPSMTTYKANQKISFIATSNNNKNATTININGSGAKNLYRPNTTNAPNLIKNKAYEVWYDQENDCFFLKASAEGDATANNVLAGKVFSNDDDTGIVGTMRNNGSVIITPSTGCTMIPEGYHDGSGYVKGDKYLVPENIREGANIFGVAGTMPNIWIGGGRYSDSSSAKVWLDAEEIPLPDLYTWSINVSPSNPTDSVFVKFKKPIYFERLEIQLTRSGYSGGGGAAIDFVGQDEALQFGFGENEAEFSWHFRELSYWARTHEIKITCRTESDDFGVITSLRFKSARISFWSDSDFNYYFSQYIEK